MNNISNESKKSDLINNTTDTTGSKDPSTNELLDNLWKALNMANGKGVFSIDEAFYLKVIYEKL